MALWNGVIGLKADRKRNVLGGWLKFELGMAKYMGYVEEQGICMNISLLSVGTPAVKCQRGLFHFMHRLYATHCIHRTLTVM